MTNRASAAIIGGSIAGCASAVVLANAGWRVTVFERSSAELTDRGAGINMLTPDLQRLQAGGLISEDIPRHPIHNYQLRYLTERDADCGRLAGAPEVPNNALHWGDLYRDLRAKIPASCLFKGCAVASISESTGSADLTLENGDRQSFDLIVAADGHDSLGRRLLCPESVIEYAGYVAWRGLLPESVIEDSRWLADTVQCARAAGVWSAFYLLPGAGGSLEPGKRWINWLIYLKTDAATLATYCVGNNGVRYPVTVPPGRLGQQAVRAFQQRADQLLPRRLAAICERSQNTFLQAIYQTAVSRYASERVVLLGDAGALASPLSAAGALKALFDAHALSEALSSSDTLQQQLRGWGEARCQAGNQFYRLGKHRAEALLFDQNSDWSTMDGDDFAAWFKASQSLPAQR